MRCLLSIKKLQVTLLASERFTQVLATSNKNCNSYRKSRPQMNLSEFVQALIGNIKGVQLLFNEHCTVFKEACYVKTIIFIVFNITGFLTKFSFFK